jgi:hypothetical protein
MYYKDKSFDTYKININKKNKKDKSIEKKLDKMIDFGKFDNGFEKFFFVFGLKVFFDEKC